MISYGAHTIGEEEKQAVIHLLHNNSLLTTGPLVEEFETKVREYVGIDYAVAVNSGTAALHLAMFSIDLQPEDEVILPAISFVATANCVRYFGANVVFCDVKENLCIDETKIEGFITPRTKAIITVGMCGQSCDMDVVNKIGLENNLVIIEDAAHSLGGTYKNRKIGTLADITCFSFHPVKTITTCEGGMMVTNNATFHLRAKCFRSHGIDNDPGQREKLNTFDYDMRFLGFNYRIPDVLCAIGIEQLKKIDGFIEKRREIARKYDAFAQKYQQFFEPVFQDFEASAFHLYIIKVKDKIDRNRLFTDLKNCGIRCNVHYKPIYWHKYYQDLGYPKQLCPTAEQLYQRILSIPIYPLLKETDFNFICRSIIECIQYQISL